MDRTGTTLALAALISAIAVPGAIHPGLARLVREHATRALRPALHRRIPSAGSPLAAFTGIGAEPDAVPEAHL
ncbi:hypothetical protein [Rathayibacter festucae]|uniref:hypothetical protein n=1 Tax=Rathayibacter festucae TaxID=110937 RepID=UPI002A6991F9|nr:hypothetical protein [Rathayibacter festucae]MDY0912243.1 hypothetical protein [Rathayibacter festucae]